MIISMTGFGRGAASVEGINATVEIKSLNSRYLDITTKLPTLLQDKEYELKEILQKEIKRGKLNVNIHLEGNDNSEKDIFLDESKIRFNTELLHKIKNIAGLQSEITLNDILTFGNIYKSEDEDVELTARKWEVVKTALQQAIDNLVAMRTREGDHLKEDFLLRLDKIQTNLDAIDEISRSRFTDLRNKLRERITALLEDENLDAERLEMEIAIMADKMDITEEVVRMRAHLKFFREAIRQPDTAGRRLNFLTQEMNRELNTMGAKANDSVISHHVIHSKEVLEQLREQIQNVE